MLTPLSHLQRAGEEGVQTYPPFMNPCIEWPKGVEFGQALRQAHDIKLLTAWCEESLLPSAEAARKRQRGAVADPHAAQPSASGTPPGGP
jgi:hypothetical protein